MQEQISKLESVRTLHWKPSKCSDSVRFSHVHSEKLCSFGHHGTFNWSQSDALFLKQKLVATGGCYQVSFSTTMTISTIGLKGRKMVGGTYSVLPANGAILKRRFNQPIARLVEETLWRLPVYCTVIVSYSNNTQTSKLSNLLHQNFSKLFKFTWKGKVTNITPANHLYHLMIISWSSFLSSYMTMAVNK